MAVSDGSGGSGGDTEGDWVPVLECEGVRVPEQVIDGVSVGDGVLDTAPASAAVADPVTDLVGEPVRERLGGLEGV